MILGLVFLIVGYNSDMFDVSQTEYYGGALITILFSITGMIGGIAVQRKKLSGGILIASGLLIIFANPYFINVFAIPTTILFLIGGIKIFRKNKLKKVKESSSKIENSGLPSKKESNEGWSKKKKIGVGVLVIVGILLVFSSIGNRSNPQTPKEVAESYSKSWIDSSPEEAYELLSSSAKKETDYSDFQTKVKAWNSGMKMQGASLKVDRVENIYQHENRAKVRVIYELEKLSVSVKEEKEMKLVKENDSWKMKEAYDPL